MSSYVLTSQRKDIGSVRHKLHITRKNRNLHLWRLISDTKSGFINVGFGSRLCKNVLRTLQAEYSPPRRYHGAILSDPTFSHSLGHKRTLSVAPSMSVPGGILLQNYFEGFKPWLFRSHQIFSPNNFNGVEIHQFGSADRFGPKTAFS